MIRIPTLTDVRAEECRRNFAEFVKDAWHVLHPDSPDVEWNWHLEAKCRHLEAVSRFVVADKEDFRPKLQHLIVNEPPGHAKSVIVSVFWNCWEWLNWPWMQTLFVAATRDLALRDSLRRKDVIRSQWYQETFGPEWEIRDDQDTKADYMNTARGFAKIAAVGATTTGLRGHKVVGDDLLSVLDAYSETKRNDAGDYLEKVIPTRVNDPRRGAFVLIQQRVHEDDPTGRVLRKTPGKWVHLNLPSEFDPESRCVTPIFSDPRTEPGELLFPAMFPKEVLADLKKTLGSADYSAQHQQNPSPAGGLIFKRAWWRYWCPRGTVYPPVKIKVSETEWIEIHCEEIPEHIDELLLSADLTFKKTEDTDYVALGVWARIGSRAYLVDRVCERMTFTETLKAIRALVSKWPRVTTVLIEDKANGPAAIDSLRTEIPGIIAVEPDGSKVARAHAITPNLEAGNVYVPHPSLVPEIEDYLLQHDQFPKAAHDDEVDQTTQALKRIFLRGKIESDDRFAQEFWGSPDRHNALASDNWNQFLSDYMSNEPDFYY